MVENLEVVVVIINANMSIETTRAHVRDLAFVNVNVNMMIIVIVVTVMTVNLGIEMMIGMIGMIDLEAGMMSVLEVEMMIDQGMIVDIVRRVESIC
jgi:hypothetical protein